MNKFIKQLLIFFCFPVFIATFFISIYIKRDVYADFGYHKNYSWKYYFQNLGDIATKKILNSKTKYNSFIFGSSRSASLYACYLQKQTLNSKFFHYASWHESIGGIYEKLKFLESKGYSLDNIIIYFDTDCTFEKDGKCRSNEHYLLTHNHKFKYYYKHFLTFMYPLDRDKLKILFGYKVNRAIFVNYQSDTFTNDCSHICNDSILKNYKVKKSGKEYNHGIDSMKKCGFLYKRCTFQKYAEKQISADEVNLLIKIKDILVKHKSKYYIVITPLYDQIKFNNSDLLIIKTIFDKNVYDFSGINRITNNEYNYHDRKHFQPCISKEIIDSIMVCR